MRSACLVVEESEQPKLMSKGVEDPRGVMTQNANSRRDIPLSRSREAERYKASIVGYLFPIRSRAPSDQEHMYV